MDDHDPGPMHKGIQEVAEMLGVTQRALRFYEDNGLISPQRVSGTRIYSRRDMGRMQLILRGKRLGFSIREIREFLDLYDRDPTQHDQISHLLTRVREKIVDLKAQQVALEKTIGELIQIEAEAAEQLSKGGA
ncbi:MerR family transcriptional regulator [Croceicoccus sediminis]|uniref:MerR family transcriptional regulator n=1 Tax=Croceicoccus sediminis TaxID=2571150 RepID=UPI00196BAE44|nr:MerR family DNA-binding transcriptional regulator [Croceicoccus sediminis]